MKKNLHVFLLIAILTALACGSSSSTGGDSQNGTTGEEESGDDSGACDANDAGNGDTLISGPSGPSGEDYDQPFRSLTVDPTDANTVFVGTERNGIFKSTDGGTNWSWLRQGIRHMDTGYPEVWNMAISPQGADDAVFAATLDSPGPVEGDYPSSIGGVYKSTDGGTTWVRSNCGLTSSRATSINFDPANADTVILGIEGGEASFSGYEGQYFDGGIFKSTDGGANWGEIELPSDGSRNGYWYMFVRNSTFFTFAFNAEDTSENVGFLKSTDSGATWSAFAGDLTNLFIANFDVSNNGQVIYANARDSFQVRKSTDGGANWTTVASNANGPIKISPSDSDLVIFGGTATLYRSTNGMTSETALFTASDTIDDIEFAPSDPTIVYAATRGYDIYKSTNSGASWSLIVNLRNVMD